VKCAKNVLIKQYIATYFKELLLLDIERTKKTSHSYLHLETRQSSKKRKIIKTGEVNVNDTF